MFLSDFFTVSAPYCIDVPGVNISSGSVNESRIVAGSDLNLTCMVNTQPFLTRLEVSLNISGACFELKHMMCVKHISRLSSYLYVN